jgi:sucrose-6-phosphate hydrolase SacC (GH32 family)
VHWTEHPVAIPQGEGEEIFSGSVVVDHGNSSGFGVGEDPPLVAIYTSAYSDGRQAQSLAFSTDAGMTWTKYFGNPILDRASTSFRDPKVSWHQTADRAGYWLMVAVEAEARQTVFYRSDDLKAWQYLSTFGPVGSTEGLWECPDVFALPVDGDPNRIKWVLIVSLNQGRADGGTSTRYFVGDFDGVRFTPASSDDFQRLDWGRDFYAAVGFDNTPRGRRILIGWMGNWSYAASVPTSPWRGSMSLPRELSLAMVEGDVRVVQQPPVELSALDQPAKRLSFHSFDLDGIKPIDGSRQYRLTVTFEPVDAHEVGIDLLVGDGQKTRLRYDVHANRLNLDRSRSGETAFEVSFASTDSAPVPLRDGALQLQVFVDRASVEVFAQGGLVCLTEQVFASSGSTGLSIYSLGGVTRVNAFQLMPLSNASEAPTHLPFGTGAEAASVEEE